MNFKPHPLPPLLKARGKNDIVDMMDSTGILTPLLRGEGAGGEVERGWGEVEDYSSFFIDVSPLSDNSTSLINSAL